MQLEQRAAARVERLAQQKADQAAARAERAADAARGRVARATAVAAAAAIEAEESSARAARVEAKAAAKAVAKAAARRQALLDRAMWAAAAVVGGSLALYLFVLLVQPAEQLEAMVASCRAGLTVRNAHGP